LYADILNAVRTANLTQYYHITGAILSKRPFESDANLAQRLRARDQLRDEIFRACRSKGFVELQDEQMTNPKFANESDLVRRRSNKMRRTFGTQNFDWMRIESNDDRRTIFGMGVSS